uniref:Uncharacterized protein n=1 Tax=Anopheles merus TaxID=30066 RepID=A0A182UWM6_ANOME
MDSKTYQKIFESSNRCRLVGHKRKQQYRSDKRVGAIVSHRPIGKQPAVVGVGRLESSSMVPLVLLLPIPGNVLLCPPPPSCVPRPAEFCATRADRLRISGIPSLDASEIDSGDRPFLVRNSFLPFDQLLFQFGLPFLGRIELGRFLLQCKFKLCLKGGKRRENSTQLHLAHHQQLRLQTGQLFAVLLPQVRLPDRFPQLVPQIEQLALCVLQLQIHLPALGRLVLDHHLQRLNLQLPLFAEFLLLVERFLPAYTLSRHFRKLGVRFAAHRTELRIQGGNLPRQPGHLILQRFVVLFQRANFTALAQQPPVALGVYLPPMAFVLQLQMQQPDVVLIVRFGQVRPVAILRLRSARFRTRFYVLVEQRVRIESATFLHLLFVLHLGNAVLEAQLFLQDAVKYLLVRLRPANDCLRRGRDGRMWRNRHDRRSCTTGLVIESRSGNTERFPLEPQLLLLLLVRVVMSTVVLQMTDRSDDGRQIVAQLAEKFLVACELLTGALFLLAVKVRRRRDGFLLRWATVCVAADTFRGRCTVVACAVGRLTRPIRLLAQLALFDDRNRVEQQLRIHLQRKMFQIWQRMAALLLVPCKQRPRARTPNNVMMMIVLMMLLVQMYVMVTLMVVVVVLLLFGHLLTAVNGQRFWDLQLLARADNTAATTTTTTTRSKRDELRRHGSPIAEVVPARVRR